MHHRLSVIDLLNYKAKMPSYQDDPRNMENLFTYIFAVFHPNWADITDPHVYPTQSRGTQHDIREGLPGS